MEIHYLDQSWSHTIMESILMYSKSSPWLSFGKEGLKLYRL